MQQRANDGAGTTLIGNFTIIDLIAATTNAFNGALLARQPEHYRKYTIMGIILIAVATGIAGGVSRDVILNTVPGALKNPAFIILCISASMFVVYDLLFGLSIWPATLIAFAFGFAFRLAANHWRWEEPLPRTPRDERESQPEVVAQPSAAAETS
jgi:uncharacterized membrane protein YeiH